MKTKYFLLTLICFCLFQISCSSSQNKVIKTLELNTDERNIINSFLAYELASAPYRFLKKDSIIIIKEAITKNEVIEDYESLMSGTENSIFDSIQIVKISKTLANESLYNWKKPDFMYPTNSPINYIRHNYIVAGNTILN